MTSPRSRPSLTPGISSTPLREPDGQRALAGTLDVRLEGTISDLRTSALVQAAGTVYLVLWRNALSYQWTDPSHGGTDLEVPREHIQTHLARRYATVRVFSPVEGGAPVSAETGTGSVAIELGDAPLLVQRSDS